MCTLESETVWEHAATESRRLLLNEGDFRNLLDFLKKPPVQAG